MTRVAGAGVQPVLSAFAGSAPALAALGVAEGPERWVDSVLRLRPDLAFHPAGVVLSTWDDDRGWRAASSCAVPGEGAASEIAAT